MEETRNSPAERIVQELMSLGADVIVYDLYCRESFGAEKAKDAYDAVRGADYKVIATDHKLFGELELGKIRELMNENSELVDGRRIVNPIDARASGISIPNS